MQVKLVNHASSLRNFTEKRTYGAAGIDKKACVTGCEGRGIFEDDMIFSLTNIEDRLGKRGEEYEGCGSSNELS